MFSKIARAGVFLCVRACVCWCVCVWVWVCVGRVCSVCVIHQVSSCF